MTEFIKADVFFFVTTIAVVVLTVVAVVFMVYLIGVMRNVRDISDLAKVQSKNISDDISELRANIKRDGVRLKHLVDFMQKPHKRTRKGNR
ncbi:MAG: hypothetical protein HZB09_02455 [Candidatus Yonathbacteria bacterium]|nr:hypothetical protein [Candidatus Yonathbacteria bacterium]